MAKRRRSAGPEISSHAEELTGGEEGSATAILRRMREKPPVTTYQKHVETPFLITPDFLTKIAKLIEKQGGHKALFNAAMSDSSKLENLSVDAILDLPNERGREILSIGIENDFDSPVRITIDLNSLGYSSGIGYRVVGSDKDATFVSRELETLCQGIWLPFWYSFLARTPDLVKWILGLILFSLSGMLITAGIQSQRILIALLGVVLFIGVMGYSPLMKWLFPAYQFAVGGGAARAESAKIRGLRIFSFVFVGVIMATGLGVFGNWIYDTFIKR